MIVWIVAVKKERTDFLVYYECGKDRSHFIMSDKVDFVVSYKNNDVTHHDNENELYSSYRKYINECF